MRETNIGNPLLEYNNYRQEHFIFLITQCQIVLLNLSDYFKLQRVIISSTETVRLSLSHLGQ